MFLRRPSAEPINLDRMQPRKRLAPAA